MDSHGPGFHWEMSEIHSDTEYSFSQTLKRGTLFHRSFNDRFLVVGSGLKSGNS